MKYMKIKYVCAQCGHEIEPADALHEGEEYCEVNGEKIHLRCMSDWSLEHKKECRYEYLYETV